MDQEVTSGAVLMCSFGADPSTLIVNEMVTASNTPAANIMDNKPFVNIEPFGVCMSMDNPAVAAATAAALGVLTPVPCTPVIPAPWIPGSPTVLVRSMPALNNSSTCICAFGGNITISGPGQFG